MADVSGMGRNERLMMRFVEILNSNDLDALKEVLHDDFVQEMPQSGELVRGLENYKAILVNYPGREKVPLKAERVLAIGEEPHYVMTPTFNLVRVQSHGDNPVGIFKLHYPDGSVWWVLWFLTIRDDKIAKEIDFFAPEFAPPEWRAQWVETMEVSSVG
jgi:hypothetical protein